MPTRYLYSLAILVFAIAILFDSHSVAAQPSNGPWFRDATKEYGPIGGGACALVDLDGDGFPDLICDGRIYKNDSGKRFVDVTKESGVSGSGKACVADIDNDGKPDIYFCGGKGRLYRNLGNFKFADCTDWRCARFCREHKNPFSHGITQKTRNKEKRTPTVLDFTVFVPCFPWLGWFRDSSFILRKSIGRWRCARFCREDKNPFSHGITRKTRNKEKRTPTVLDFSVFVPCFPWLGWFRDSSFILPVDDCELL